jgi:hypothetical protein
VVKKTEAERPLPHPTRMHALQLQTLTGWFGFHHSGTNWCISGQGQRSQCHTKKAKASELKLESLNSSVGVHFMVSLGYVQA